MHWHPCARPSAHTQGPPSPLLARAVGQTSTPGAYGAQVGNAAACARPLSCAALRAPAPLQVVLTTAGPYAQMGNLLVEQAVEQGTHYCDLTGACAGTACAPHPTPGPAWLRLVRTKRAAVGWHAWPATFLA